MIGLNEENFDVKTIVGQMGPAPITTVVGMAARIYMTQFDAITTEPEAETLASIGTPQQIEKALITLNESSAIPKIMKEHQEKATRYVFITRPSRIWIYQILRRII